jgi:glycosyltransferase involved in cell wall biosynthesis
MNTDHSLLSSLLRTFDPSRSARRVGTTDELADPAVPSIAAQLNLPRSPSRPFLSVVTRTQGRRLASLQEVLQCLAAQTELDFEHLIILHRAGHDESTLVRQLVEHAPLLLRERIRILVCDEGNRTRPLNVAFAEASGAYVAVLDDDDIVFANWVEVFRGLARTSSGKILRAVAVKQKIELAQPEPGQFAIRAVEPIDKEYPSEFDLLGHLRKNLSPPCCLAFPRSAFTDLGIRFDESLSTTEDWDYLMRVAFVCGVASSPQVTSIYRWWVGAESSRTEHSQAEWLRNRQTILDKLDQEIVLLEPGTTRRLRELMERCDALTRQLYELIPRLDGEALPAETVALLDAPDAAKRMELVGMTSSSTWKLLDVLRRIRCLLRGTRFARVDVMGIPSSQLQIAIDGIRSSLAWRLAAPLRAAEGLMRGKSRKWR